MKESTGTKKYSMPSWYGLIENMQFPEVLIGKKDMFLQLLNLLLNWVV